MHLTIKIELTPAKTCLGKKTGKYNACLYGKEFHGTKKQIESDIEKYLTASSKPADITAVSNGEEINLVIADQHDGRAIYKFPSHAGVHSPVLTAVSGGSVSTCVDVQAVHLASIASNNTPDSTCPNWLPESARQEFETLQRYARTYRATL